MRIGMVGLGKMGLNMARRLIEGGHEVVGHAHHEAHTKDSEQYGIEGAYTLEELVDKLPERKVVWLMVPAGSATEEIMSVLKGLLSVDDIIIDGGNTFYKDDLRRAEELKEEDTGISYVDCGTSGGIWGLTEGYCLMVGADPELFSYLEPIFKTLGPEGGYMRCGPVGAGHFVKMVHNGIEYGMMQAYGEGFELMRESPYGEGLDLGEVADLWGRGSVVRSWLLELLTIALKEDPGLEGLKGYVEDSGEGRWTVQESVDLGVSTPVITASLFARFSSRKDNAYSNRVLAALRNQFGGHAVKKS